MFVLFAITWNARRFLDNHYLLFVGIAASFIGILDLLHTLTYKGMNIIQSPLYFANQFWIATRFFESIVLLSGFLFVSNRLNIRIKHLLIVYTIATVAIILSILYFKNFPTCYIDGIGQTPFKIISEYVIIAILITALVVLIKNKKYFEHDTYSLITASIVLTIASEFSFTLYIANYDYINKVGHIFKVLSFYMIYKANIQNGFTKPFETFFRELKISEEKVKQANLELEKQISTKNKFFSIISHDLRNPFSVLLGFSELLLKNHNKYDDAEREKIIRTLYGSSEKTFRLLENLLAWSRVQTNSIPFKPVKFDIKDIIDENILLLRSNAKIKNIEIVREYNAELVFADVDMVKTIVRNLLSNAVKFTLREGVITITTKRELSVVYISISDTGVGIAPDKIQKLFKIDKTYTTRGTENESGTGLGLLLSYEFAIKNNGEITVESEVNKGSTFTLSLPGA
jgi:signal transduction histidine kinase